MTLTYDDVRKAVLQLPKPDQARLLAFVAQEIGNVHPGIDFNPDICGGSARIVRTRIPVWTLEAARQQRSSDADLLAAYPSLTAEDLANARNYTHVHRDEINREIAENNHLS
jgi:uncharacterized protein (DUF433 family)